MVDYGLKDKVALITGVNNPQGIGATTALAFAREGAKLVLVYKKIDRPFDKDKTCKNGVDRYYAANAGDAGFVEDRLREMHADYLILESDVSVRFARMRSEENGNGNFFRLAIAVRTLGFFFGR